MDWTVRLRRLVQHVTYKKKAPRAVHEIKKIASRAMRTKDVRIDTKLNEFVWSRGIKKLPHRVRVRFDRRRNDEEEAKERFYTVVELVECSNFKGLLTEKVEEN